MLAGCVVGVGVCASWEDCRFRGRRLSRSTKKLDMDSIGRECDGASFSKDKSKSRYGGILPEKFFQS